MVSNFSTFILWQCVLGQASLVLNVSEILEFRNLQVGKQPKILITECMVLMSQNRGSKELKNLNRAQRKPLNIIISILTLQLEVIEMSYRAHCAVKSRRIQYIADPYLAHSSFISVVGSGVIRLMIRIQNCNG